MFLKDVRIKARSGDILLKRLFLADAALTSIFISLNKSSRDWSFEDRKIPRIFEEEKY
ncbi:hypothetical protein Hs30E_06370 [Lactococcus hodotermopsidis]|uniref:Uncharacterized protein n=1 Tax=Pseudolactococcus hodotermopsidis TaxID=2709157 RepID=A0A6A0BB93_9LACT|nr:hypothetical protein [Lactococcus hodotermopsidis]GFH42086.1 hypothetical protein Hs30E_06370 [Lactococcus hodotermopsidis]